MIEARKLLTMVIIGSLMKKSNGSTGTTHNHNATPSTELINLVIREHQTSAQAWKYQALLRELYTWVERFKSDFELNIPMPVIAITRPKRRRFLGLFIYGHNPLGITHQITIIAI